MENILCKLGIHKPVQSHTTFRHKCRTTNKGRSKKRYRTWCKELYTVTYCARCYKTLRQKSKLIWN